MVLDLCLSENTTHSSAGRGGKLPLFSLASASDGYAEALFIQRLRKGMLLADNFDRGIWTVTGIPRR